MNQFGFFILVPVKVSCRVFIDICCRGNDQVDLLENDKVLPVPKADVISDRELGRSLDSLDHKRNILEF